MKIKKINKYKTKLIDLKLINTKILNKKNLFENTNLKEIKYQLKKSLQVIYKYHITDKKILFIGNLTQLNNNIKLKYMNHTWINEYNLKNGLVTNNNSISNPYDLIVILNYQYSKSIVNEAESLKIPTICLNINLNIMDINCLYKIPGNFKFSEKPIRNKFFFTMLEATIKKANYFKNKKKYFPQRKNAFQKKKSI